MRKYLCKIFSFLLDLVSLVVDLVANTLIKVGTATVEVLSDIANSIGTAIIRNPLVLGIFGIAAFFLLPKLFPAKEEKKEPIKGNQNGSSN